MRALHDGAQAQIEVLLDRSGTIGNRRQSADSAIQPISAVVIISQLPGVGIGHADEPAVVRGSVRIEAIAVLNIERITRHSAGMFLRLGNDLAEAVIGLLDLVYDRVPARVRITGIGYRPAGAVEGSSQSFDGLIHAGPKRV